MDLGVAKARALKSQLTATFINAGLNLRNGATRLKHDLATSFTGAARDLKNCTTKLKGKLSASFLNAVLRRTPALLRMLNTADPEGRLNRFVTKTAYDLFKFKEGDEFYPAIPQHLKRSLLKKPERRIDPLFAPKAYLHAFDNPWTGPRKTIHVGYEGETERRYLRLKKYVNDYETGFRGAVYQDNESHSIVILGGIHLDGSEALYHGIESIAQPKIRRRVNQQIRLAQDLYLKALRKSESVEVIGYSLGSMLARDLAARLHAKVTVFADIGLPGEYTSSQARRSESNVVSLRLPDDLFTGQADPHAMHGQIIELPEIASERVRRIAAEFDWPKPDDVLNTHAPEVYYFVTRAMRHEKAAALKHALRMTDATDQQPNTAHM